MKWLHLEASVVADEIVDLWQQLWHHRDMARGCGDGAGNARG